MPAAPSVVPDEDARSYTERFAGTQWGTPPPEPVPAPAPKTRRWWLAVVLVASLVALGAAGLVAIESGPSDIELTREVVWVLLLVVPLAGGRVSMVVPGRMARGSFKGWIVGFVGWFALGLPAVLLTRAQFPASIGYARGAVDHIIVAILGASILRLILMPFG